MKCILLNIKMTRWEIIICMHTKDESMWYEIYGDGSIFNCLHRLNHPNNEEREKKMSNKNEKN